MEGNVSAGSAVSVIPTRSFTNWRANDGAQKVAREISKGRGFGSSSHCEIPIRETLSEIYLSIFVTVSGAWLVIGIAT